MARFPISILLRGGVLVAVLAGAVIPFFTADVSAGAIAEGGRGVAVYSRPVNFIPGSPELEARIAMFSSADGARIGDIRIAAKTFLPKFYAARGYQRVWTNPDNIAALKTAVSESWRDGLQRADFHPEVLGLGGRAPTLTPDEMDIVLSDALVRLLYQLYFGKVSPDKLDSHWNYERSLPNEDPIAAIANALETGQVGALIDQVRLDHPYYLGLRATLEAFAALDTQGGWETVPEGPLLKPGDVDVRTAVLRKRLMISGDLAEADSASTDVYDDALVAAVKSFQARHGLDVDGVIGAGTLKALNTTVKQRIDQIRVNLERARWVVRGVRDTKDFIVVNIAGFYLRVFFDGKPVWKTEVITGKPYHKTPVFHESMKYVVLNPDWVVPASIARNEIAPKARADAGYFAKHNYRLLSSSGEPVAPASIDWSKISAKSFPYRVVQQPGPNNALGRVKFIFPNKYNVYLHDTPSRQLFGKTGRAFSHGCIRVKDPLKLAEIVLGQRADYTRAQIDATIASKKMKRVNLKAPLRVAILYWTVDPDPDGRARFYDDVYGRDARVLKALNAAFQPKPLE